MGDFMPENSELEGEENIIAAAKYLVKALNSNKNLTEDTKKVVADLGKQISKMTLPNNETKIEEIRDIENRLSLVEEKIMNWEADGSMMWDDSAFDYLNAADEALRLTEKLMNLSLNKGEERAVLMKAHDVLQIAMEKLEEQFKHMLFRNSQPYELDLMSSFHSSEEDVTDEGSIVSFGDDLVHESVNRSSIGRVSGEFIVNLVHPDVIPELRGIANVMFGSNYDQECIQAYTNVRRDALDDCLFILEMEKLSIEDVLKMEWRSLNSKIRRWTRVMKIFVRVYLSSEKRLCDQIFGEGRNIACFEEASKGSVFQLLNFGEAMALGPHTPEKLSCILDMYEVLRDLLPDIEGLYTDEVGSPIRIAFHEVLQRLGESVRATFLEFKKAIETNKSANAFAGGGIHKLTNYVMNYLWILTDYTETINLLLKDNEDDDPISTSPDANPNIEDGDKHSGSLSKISPMARYFVSLSSVLECNLVEKSKLYRDTALQHFFLMNNNHYMAEKVKGSELRLVFGDEWLRKRNWKFQQHALSYERASWISILAFLKDDGNQYHDPRSVPKNLLKERLRKFYLAFEEIYKNQTGWVIPNVHLREDLRISINLNVIQAYRIFVGRHGSHISEKLIKYSGDDLENYLLDLFEGSPKSLQNYYRS